MNLQSMKQIHQPWCKQLKYIYLNVCLVWQHRCRDYRNLVHMRSPCVIYTSWPETEVSLLSVTLRGEVPVKSNDITTVLSSSYCNLRAVKLSTQVTYLQRLHYYSLKKKKQKQKRTYLVCSITVPNNEFAILRGTDQEPGKDRYKNINQKKGDKYWQMTKKCVILPGIRSPVHGIDFSQMSPQCSSCTHLDSPHGVNISCDLENIKELIKVGFFASFTELLPVYCYLW